MNAKTIDDFQKKNCVLLSEYYFQQTEQPKPNSSEATKHSVSDRKERYLIISKSNPKKPHLSGKYITYSEWMEHNGETYYLNAKKSGIYTGIMHKAIDQLNICHASWGRVFMYRFDFHPLRYSKDNKLVSKLIDRIKKKTAVDYVLPDIGYLWTREQEKKKHQHYHVVLLLDGDKIQHPAKLLRSIESLANRFGWHIGKAKNAHIMIENLADKLNAVYRFSYLAKGRGKGYQGKQCNNYSTSRLRKNHG